MILSGDLQNQSHFQNITTYFPFSLSLSHKCKVKSSRGYVICDTLTRENSEADMKNQLSSY